MKLAKPTKLAQDLGGPEIGAVVQIVEVRHYPGTSRADTHVAVLRAVSIAESVVSVWLDRGAEVAEVEVDPESQVTVWYPPIPVVMHDSVPPPLTRQF